jgi:hypothetical protein
MTAMARASSNCIRHPTSRQDVTQGLLTASVQLENTITGRESQGACRQDELIGGKPPVVKQL